MFVITYIAALLAIILAVSAVAFVCIQRSTKLTNALTLYAATAALWIGGNAAADVSYTVPSLILTSGLAFTGGALSILMFLILVDLLVDERMPSRLRILSYAVPTVGICPFAFSTLAIIDTYFPVGAPAQIMPGPLYMVTLVIMVASLFYGVTRLILGLKREQQEVRRVRLSYVLLGLILMLLGGLTFDMVLPLMGELRFYTLGPIASIFFILGTGYAIAAHSLIDIRIGIQRGVVYSFLLVIIIVAYTTILELVLILSPLTSETAVSVSAGITIVAGIFGVPLIEQYFRALTDSIFFKQTYDYAEVVHTLSEIFYQHVELSEFLSAAQAELARVLRATVIRIEREQKYIDMPDFDATESGRFISVPMHLNGSYIGSIYAYPKRSGDAYTTKDRRLLETFAYQAAIAFSRAELYDKTRQYTEELERTVVERTHELQRAQENERQTLIELSHNLQTPLVVFQARLEQLKHSGLASRDAYPLEQSVQRLSNFIYDLLALAKLESEAPKALIEIDLSDLMEGIMEEVTVIATSTQARIEHKITPNIRLWGDEKRLREAIINIASNALKYMRTDGDRRITFHLTQEQETACLAVVDTGQGISAADLPHVFERFYRGTHASERSAGNGLGLTIVKHIIERHQGEIAIESIEGNGTSVLIRLPIQP